MHALMRSCTCRAWNAETAITGGLVADDLLSIVWNKIAALTGGSQEWPIGLGLRPWYLKVLPFHLLGIACTSMTCCCCSLQSNASAARKPPSLIIMVAS